MKLSELEFDFPPELIATHRSPPSRVMVSTPGQIQGQEQGDHPSQVVESSVEGVLAQFSEGDILVVNNTKVLKRRVFAENGLEVLFLKQISTTQWEVLFPSARLKLGEVFVLKNNIHIKLIRKGRPQYVETSIELNESFFEAYGELPLPPYIQKARGERHNQKEDLADYQTSWAAKPGSFAAPTASFHFTNPQLEALKARGVKVVEVTLHIGLGTFLPVQADDLDKHTMHLESAFVKHNTWLEVLEAKQRGKKVWALGTTVVRTLESLAIHQIPKNSDGDFQGETGLLIQPGFEFQVVDVLMTNFHQPKSTLLALVCGFAGTQRVKAHYKWAIEHQFRLFSYGDLSVWHK